MILGPGLYNAAGAISLTGILILDAGGDPNAVWYININAAFTTAANSQINVDLVAGGQTANVYWIVTGAASFAAGSAVVGNIVADGAVALGADATVEGSIASVLGAVSLGAGASVNGAVMALGAVVLGADATVDGSIESVGGAVSLGVGGRVNGGITAGGAVDLGANVTVDGSIESVLGAVTLGVGGRVNGAIAAAGGVGIGAESIVLGTIKAGGAVILGADVLTGYVTTPAAITFGVGAEDSLSYAPSESPSSEPSISGAPSF
jgi:predicted acyltransferase (DUF342 family)